MKFDNVYFINGTAYAGKSTLVAGLAGRYGGVALAENYQDACLPDLDPAEYPALTYTRDLRDWHDFVRRTPEEYEAWINSAASECERLELQIIGSLPKDGRPVFVEPTSPSRRFGRYPTGTMCSLCWRSRAYR